MSKRRRRSPIRSRSRNRLGSWWPVWRVPILLAIVSAAWWFFYRPYVYEQGWEPVESRFALCGSGWSGAAGCVVDGDTLVIGNGPSRRRIRLTGFDAPERDGACQAEIERAEQARQALFEWLSRGPFEWNGGVEPPRDQYGRELREVRRVASDGKRAYLREFMISRGLASGSGWGSAPADWCQ